MKLNAPMLRCLTTLFHLPRELSSGAMSNTSLEDSFSGLWKLEAQFQFVEVDFSGFRN
jgi:hypothetical protein